MFAQCLLYICACAPESSLDCSLFNTVKAVGIRLVLCVLNVCSLYCCIVNLPSPSTLGCLLSVAGFVHSCRSWRCGVLMLCFLLKVQAHLSWFSVLSQCKLHNSEAAINKNNLCAFESCLWQLQQDSFFILGLSVSLVVLSVLILGHWRPQCLWDLTLGIALQTHLLMLLYLNTLSRTSCPPTTPLADRSSIPLWPQEPKGIKQSLRRFSHWNWFLWGAPNGTCSPIKKLNQCELLFAQNTTASLAEQEAGVFDSRLSTPGNSDFQAEIWAVLQFLVRCPGAEG